MRILAGDIGGTHARLVYLQGNQGQAEPVPPVRHEKIYRCQDYASLTAVIEDFITLHNIQWPLDSVCLAVAGPVVDGRASLTNLPWQISEAALATRLKTERVSLINDLAAAAYAIPGLHDDAMVVLQQGEEKVDLTLPLNAAVIGVGTGLGAAHLIWQDNRYQALSSEAGHASFAAVNATQEHLLSWLHQKHDHVSAEMLLSGRGIHTLYQFFRDEVGLPESSAVNTAMQDADPAQVISEHAVAADDALCTQTLTCFIEIFAAVVGDITLHYYPVNAVYLVGGIAPKIQRLLVSSAFSEAFCNKGPRRDELQKLPVKLVTSAAPGLEGAIAYARSVYACSVNIRSTL